MPHKNDPPVGFKNMSEFCQHSSLEAPQASCKEFCLYPILEEEEAGSGWGEGPLKTSELSWCKRTVSRNRNIIVVIYTRPYKWGAQRDSNLLMKICQSTLLSVIYKTFCFDVAQGCRNEAPKWDSNLLINFCQSTSLSVIYKTFCFDVAQGRTSGGIQIRLELPHKWFINLAC